MALTVEKNSLLEQKDRLVKYGPLAAVVVTVTIYFLSQFAGALIVWLYPAFRGWSEVEALDWLSNSNYAQFFFVLAVEAISLGLLWAFMRRRNILPRQIGLTSRPNLKDIWYGVIGFLAYFGLYIAILSVVQQLIPGLNIDQKQELGFDTNTTGLALGAVFISLVVLPPVVEEIMARGFLYTGLKQKLPKVVAALITSTLFALAHLQFGSGKSLLWIAAIDTFILSMVLVYLREKTNTLWAPFMIHGTKNAIAFVSLFILQL